VLRGEKKMFRLFFSVLLAVYHKFQISIVHDSTPPHFLPLGCVHIERDLLCDATIILTGINRQIQRVEYISIVWTIAFFRVRPVVRSEWTI
jgi:hypothetical protein